MSLPVINRRPEADCPFCGKAEGDAYPACHGVNATAGAEKKRRARVESERARGREKRPVSDGDRNHRDRQARAAR